MLRKLIAIVLVLTVPGLASAGPIKDAAAKAAKELAVEQVDQSSRARKWTGIALLSGGALLALLSGVEFGDDEEGPDDDADADESDDGEDEDGWGGKALTGVGIGAAILGGVMVFKSRTPGPAVAFRHGGVTIRQTIRF